MPNSNKTLRILRGGGPEAVDAPQPKPVNPAPPAQSQAQNPAQQQRPQAVAPEQPAAPRLTPREEIEQIKQENLTGRELRIARRMAQRHNLSPTSDLDAVRLLRGQGIDPFSKQEIGSVLAPVPAEGQEPNVALPATVRKSPVSDHKPQVIDDDSREREVRKIQKGLVKRRRKRLGILMVKLACYVFLPSIIAGYYFYKVATPMYATYSEFVIQSADAPGVAGAAGLFSGSPLETVTDSITVQGYLTSRDAMLRLDAGPGFRTLFQGDNIDVLQRLEDDASNEESYKAYKKRIIIGFDPTEGAIKMEVITPSPESSKQISATLIQYAEERVEQLTSRLRNDQMSGAEEIYNAAEINMEKAFDEVARLQIDGETLNAEGENTIISGQISSLETQITEKELELSRLLNNARPNRTKVKVLESDISLLKRKIEEQRAKISQTTATGQSIIRISADLRKAEGKLVVRQQLLATALQNLESARVEAGRQTRYISMGVSPVTPDKASYPRSFENTLLAFVVFAGIYLMLSLTVSILREQVTT
ncbi:capsule biosynthesis protein [Amylibacter sp.]|nr:capsule biosynthesis protein [Amylibacter sp.]